MARVTPEEFAEKHNRRLKAALPDMEAGIRKVSEAPTKAGENETTSYSQD